MGLKSLAFVSIALALAGCQGGPNMWETNPQAAMALTQTGNAMIMAGRPQPMPAAPALCAPVHYGYGRVSSCGTTNTYGYRQ